MQTQISAALLATERGQRADRILRSCVHCGFCTATCPTYQLLGDELDGPRGRIYLIKQMLEGAPVSGKTQSHLDRCLTCRSCETTCPSGVAYGQLLDIGREFVEQRVARPRWQRLQRYLLRQLLPRPRLMGPLLALARALRPLMPAALASKVPALPAPLPAQAAVAAGRRMLALAGCVQSVATPNTLQATGNLLRRLGIELEVAPQSGCCGAVSQHLAAPDEARDYIRRNIDAWWPRLQQGAEAIVITASGCGAMVKEYGDLMRDDPDYADKARQISERTRDIVEVLEAEPLDALALRPGQEKLAFHCPCTLQHGQQLGGRVEALLQGLGFSLATVRDSHLCCGSAGTYSLLQPELSGRLLANKLDALQQDDPQQIVTANVGCQLHLASATGTPVRHWIELLEQALR
jgi:glycolate oxidase iron-sulfur subunit